MSSSQFKNIYIYIQYIGSQIYQTIKLDCKVNKSHVFKKNCTYHHFQVPKKENFPQVSLTSPIHPFFPSKRTNQKDTKAWRHLWTCQLVLSKVSASCQNLRHGWRLQGIRSWWVSWWGTGNPWGKCRKPTLEGTPWKTNVTCPLKRDYFNRKYIFQTIVFRFYVNLRGCTTNSF